jgi:hypothetical protein
MCGRSSFPNQEVTVFQECRESTMIRPQPGGLSLGALYLRIYALLTVVGGRVLPWWESWARWPAGSPVNLVRSVLVELIYWYAWGPLIPVDLPAWSSGRSGAELETRALVIRQFLASLVFPQLAWLSPGARCGWCTTSGPRALTGRPAMGMLADPAAQLPFVLPGVLRAFPGLVWSTRALRGPAWLASGGCASGPGGTGPAAPGIPAGPQRAAGPENAAAPPFPVQHPELDLQPAAQGIRRGPTG